MLILESDLGKPQNWKTSSLFNSKQMQFFRFLVIKFNSKLTWFEVKSFSLKDLSQTSLDRSIVVPSSKVGLKQIFLS